jgi:hypothetical protein
VTGRLPAYLLVLVLALVAALAIVSVAGQPGPTCTPARIR